MTPTPDSDTIAVTSQHDTRARYKHGCRCDDCRAANTIYQRRRRHALRQHDTTSKSPPSRWGVEGSLALLASQVGSAVAGRLLR